MTRDEFVERLLADVKQAPIPFYAPAVHLTQRKGSS